MTTWRLRLVSARGEGAAEVLLNAEASATFADVGRALETMGITGRAVSVNGITPDQSQTLGDAGLIHGDAIGVGHTDPIPAARQPGTYLVAVSGPEAGRWTVVPPGGDVTVGRATESRFRLNDALVSGQHLRLKADTAGRVHVQDLGSSNGTFLEGAPLEGVTEIGPGQYLQVGATVLTLVQIRDSELHLLTAPKHGAKAFQRQFRPALPPLPPAIVPPDEPRDQAEEEKGRQWLQLALPLISGLGFAALSIFTSTGGNGKTRALLYIPIILITPLLMFGYQRYRKRKERAKQRAEREKYEQELATHQAQLADAQASEQKRRRHAAVVGGEAILMSQLAHHRLWEREPTDPDFLEVCIGLATQPSAIRTSKDRDAVGDPLWGIPLEVSVRETGSLLVSGEPRRGRAVGRSIVLNLAATHSPRDVQVSVFTTEDRASDWNWARWLPHCFGESGTSRLFATADSRDAMLSSLVRRIDTWEGPPPANAHVVVIDGASIVDGSRLTTVLRRGPAAGVYGVVLDERITPEGVRGTLRIGEMPDEGVFASSTMSETTGILTAELAVAWAEPAALSMAGFQPASAEDSRATSAEVHLIDLSAQGRLDAQWVRERWAASPREGVVVGQSGKTLVMIDIVRHGPHAIVGGATRSGKTEFLLTWLTSLCLNNSPDDLAILVADFKGGVDHVQTAKLPHVVSLSTNKDIRAFERTLIMLEAETKRREDMFTTVGASNIEAYRVARKRDGGHPPVPRLLVVVDEFSELRQTDREGGGGYMGRLESVARVGAGLGIHLILVTQNFADGQLPAQIESQIGLGVCFRVEEGAHSKVVLHSPVASTIPADRPGRGWARLRGLDLQEFQSARVAGRRRDLASSGGEVHIEFVPFTTVCSAAADLASGAVPHDETDLVTFIAAMNEAAAGHLPPVPWPTALDDATTLAQLFTRARQVHAAGAPIGLADLPAKQVQQLSTLTDQDTQITVLGGSGAAVGEVLLTMATSSALTYSPAQMHLYGIDLESNWLQGLASLPHTGAVAVLSDDVALRILRRLRMEAERRRALFDHEGVTDLAGHVRVSGHALARIVLYVNGADRLAGSAANEASALWRPLNGLVADSAGTGIDIVLGGGPAIIGRPITQRATRRFVLALPDPSVYRAVEVPRSAEVDLAVAGRAFDTTRQQVVQFGRIAPSSGRVLEVVDALGAALTERFRDVDGGPEPMPEVRWPLPWSRLDMANLRIPQGYGDALPVGVEADSGRWLWLDIEEDGPLLAIGGQGRSGRSAALIALGELARAMGWLVQAVAPSRRSPLHASMFAVTGNVAALTPATTARTLYLIDDVHRLETDADVAKILTESTRPVVLAVAGTEDVLSRKTGALRGTPDLRAAITIGTLGMSAIGGGRIPDHLRSDARAGRGVLWRAGELVSMVVPLHPSATDQT